MTLANNLPADKYSAIYDMVRQMTELLELQTTVNQLLEEEKEGAGVTVKTKALSVIVNKTFEQACKWVSLLQ